MLVLPRHRHLYAEVSNVCFSLVTKVFERIWGASRHRRFAACELARIGTCFQKFSQEPHPLASLNALPCTRHAEDRGTHGRDRHTDCLSVRAQDRGLGFEASRIDTARAAKSLAVRIEQLTVVAVFRDRQQKIVVSDRCEVQDHDQLPALRVATAVRVDALLLVVGIDPFKAVARSVQLPKLGTLQIEVYRS